MVVKDAVGIKPVESTGKAIVAEIGGKLFVGISAIHAEVDRCIGYKPKARKEAPDGK